MKKLVAFTFVFTSLLLSAFAQENSLLWEVSKKNKKLSYLYGTVHVQDKRVFAFDSIVYEKLSMCDAFAMEVLMDEIDQAEAMEAMLMKKHTLKDLYSQEEYEFLDSVVKESTGQGLFVFNKMKPFFLSSQLMQMELSMDMELALDLHFLEYARNNEKICLGIEKFKDQIKAIDAISIEDQADMLYEGLTDTSSNLSMDAFDELLEAYILQDIDKLYELSADTTMPAEFNEYFLVKRNKKMARRIIKFGKKQPTFNAIGAAHLPGEEGVIALLRQKGYTVKPVKFEFTTEE
jgi:uncharacterized protein